MMIAAACLGGEPSLLLADEPTTSLDVTIEAQVLQLLRDLRRELGLALILVTHNLALVAELCDRVLVMYAGRIVESAPVADIFREPRHPYARALLSGLLPLQGEPPEELAVLPGHPPQPEEWPTGCRFHPRCPLRTALGNPERCETEQPVADERQPHWAACHFSEQVERMDPVLTSGDDVDDL